MEASDRELEIHFSKKTKYSNPISGKRIFHKISDIREAPQLVKIDFVGILIFPSAAYFY